LNERDVTLARYRRDSHALQARFQSVLDAAPDAMVLVDESGRIALSNSPAEELFGYGREELVGEPVEILVPERFHQAHLGHRARYFASPLTRPMGIGLELWGRRKDGSEFPVEISLSPIVIDGDRLAMAAIRDVTRRRRTEKALEAANEELEAFTHSVSHDLRAPIRQIDGFTRILAERLGDHADPEIAHYLRRVVEGTGRMGRLVDDLLNLARLGRQDVRPRPVALKGLVDAVIADLQPECARREIIWEVGVLPLARCDAGLMRVALTNLLSNAVKYTRPRASARIEVTPIERDGLPGLCIRDNGVGFDMRYADKLFGVFQRLHPMDEFEGTGVGLATVQRIVHKHGGRIWAEASPGEGAAFSFTFADAAPNGP
jgi:PAS domain S-box-containing protein